MSIKQVETSLINANKKSVSKPNANLTGNSSSIKRGGQEGNEGMSTESRVLIALGALAAVAIAGIAIYKGKWSKTAQTVRGAENKLVEQLPDVSHRTEEIIEFYPNQKVVEAIKSLQGTKEEKLEAAKEIFMQEMGYEPNLIKIKFFDDASNTIEKELGSFDLYDGSLCLNRTIIEQMSPEEAISVLRHELDHFDKAAKLCKAIGVEAYQKLFTEPLEGGLKSLDYTDAVFGLEFWKAAIKNATFKGFEIDKYKKAFRDHVKPNLSEFIEDEAYYNLLAGYLYRTNPIEVSAYDIEQALEKSLNCYKKPQLDYMVEDFEKANNALAELVKRQPELKQYKLFKIFNFIFDKAEAIIYSNGTNSRHELKSILQKIPEIAKGPISEEEITKIINS